MSCGRYLSVLGTLCVMCLASMGSPSAEQLAPTANAGQAGGQTPRDPAPFDFDNHPDWMQIFDGKSLAGWDGNPEVWRVVDGALVGSFVGPPDQRNGGTFLVRRDEIADFELKLEIKLEGPTADSGIQYRAYPSGQTNAWNLGGYQFDFNSVTQYWGEVAEAGAGARGVIAFRGQVVHAEDGQRPRIIGTTGAAETLASVYKPGEWNQVHLIARGNILAHFINGHLIAMLVDEDAKRFKTKGMLGLQCAGRGTVTISFRNMWLKTL